MKSIVRNIILTTLLMFTQTALSVNLPQFDRNTSTLNDQTSPRNAVLFEDAYVSYKYVGGLVLIMTFSVPNVSHHKEFYLVTEPQNNKSVKSRIARSMNEFKYGRKNTLWIGNSADGKRSRFIMKVFNIFNPSGPYTLWAKMGNYNLPGKFTLKKIH